MKLLPILLASAAVLAGLFAPAAAQEATRGRLIGDGKNTPREIVAGKSGATRTLEIAKWMTERGAKVARNCTPEGGCAWVARLVLTNDEHLILKTWDDGESNYCRSNTHVDTLSCYNMISDGYFKQIFVTATKKWAVVWREKDGSSEQPASRTPVKQPSDIEL